MTDNDMHSDNGNIHIPRSDYLKANHTYRISFDFGQGLLVGELIDVRR